MWNIRLHSLRNMRNSGLYLFPYQHTHTHKLFMRTLQMNNSENEEASSHVCDERWSCGVYCRGIPIVHGWGLVVSEPWMGDMTWNNEFDCEKASFCQILINFSSLYLYQWEENDDIFFRWLKSDFNGFLASSTLSIFEYKSNDQEEEVEVEWVMSWSEAGGGMSGDWMRR